MRVLFRVDASAAIGTGHVMRCLALADRLTVDGAECIFVMRRHPEAAGIERVVAHGHAVSTLEPSNAQAVARAGDTPHAAWLGTEWETDAADTIAAISRLGAPCDWLVVDHYALDRRWEMLMRSHVGRLMVIDDLADRPHDCDMLLDQNLQPVGQDRYGTLTPAHCRVLLGPRYALLRPEFAVARLKLSRDGRRRARSILIFFGGVDSPGLTIRALEGVEAVRTADVKVDVVVGGSNPRKAEIEAWCETKSWATFHSEVSDMAELMAASDLAIGAGGVSTWERSAMSLPSIAIAIASNQKPGMEALADAGATLYLGEAYWVEVADIAAAVRVGLANPWLRQRMGMLSGTLVDGRGADRVSQALRAPAIRLRRAVEGDCDAMFVWRNHEGSRRYAGDKSPIDPESHRRWFAAAVVAPETDLLIAEIGDEAVAVLRFDHAGDAATVSIYLVPGRAGRGEGSEVLRSGKIWLAAERPKTRTVEARILTANSSSQRAFTAAGFKAIASTYSLACESLGPAGKPDSGYRATS